MRRSNGKKSWITLLEGGSPASGLNRDGNAPIDAKVEEVVPDILPTSPTYSGSLGASHGAEGTQKPRWVDIASQAEEAEEAHNLGDLPDFVESPAATAEDEALQDVVDTQKSLHNLGGVMETMMSNLHKTAKNHILACKKDFGYRCQNHDPNTGKSAGHVVPHMDRNFPSGSQGARGIQSI